MSISKITYTCDICEKEIEHSRIPYMLSYTVNFENQPEFMIDGPAEDALKHICENCAETIYNEVASDKE
jgi:hypothetical protein